MKMAPALACLVLAGCVDTPHFRGEGFSQYYRGPAEETQGPRRVESREILHWTNDPREQARFADEVEAGVIFFNAMVASDPRLPFGGVKNTGNGGREAGTSAIDEFTEIKTVFVDYSNRLQKAQIREE